MNTKRRKLSRDGRNGHYYVRIQVGGVRKYFSLGLSRKKAEVELTRLERLHAQGDLDINSSQEAPAPEPLVVKQAGIEITLKELTDIHLKWVEDHRAPSTHALRKRYLLAFLDHAGNRPVSEIDKLTLADFHGWAKKNCSKSKNGGNVFLRNVKSMLLWAEDMHICPCPVRKFPYMPKSPPLTKRFTDQELTILLDCIKPVCPDLHDMILFGLLTGLRPPELREVQREHVIRPEEGHEYLVNDGVVP